MTTPESTEVGGAIGRIKADDPDVGRNAEMEYSIVGGHDIFNIVTDQKTQEGVIVIKKVQFGPGGTRPRINTLVPFVLHTTMFKFSGNKVE